MRSRVECGNFELRHYHGVEPLGLKQSNHNIVLADVAMGCGPGTFFAVISLPDEAERQPSRSARMPNTFKFHGRAGHYTYWLMQAPRAHGLPMQAGLYIFAAADAAKPQPVFIEETRSLLGSRGSISQQWKIAQKDHGASLFYIHCVPWQAIRQKEKDDLVAKHQPVMNSAGKPKGN
jgi:hypothetical protein